MRIKQNLILLLLTTGVSAQNQQAEWRSQPEVLNPTQSITDQSSEIDLSELKKMYVAKNQPVVLFLKGRELTNEITDWSSNRRVKLTQNLRAEDNDLEGKKASIRIDNAIHAEVENKQGTGFSDSGYISTKLQQLLDGANDAFSEVGLRQASYAAVLKKQQMINEQKKITKRVADVTKIEFDAIANQTDWLFTSTYERRGFQFQIIDSKSGIILAQQSISENQVKDYRIVAGSDDYEEIAVSADYSTIGFLTTLELLDSALRAYE